MVGIYIGLGTISGYFAWDMARLGTIFNLNFAILHAKVASNSLIICEHLGRYLKEL